MDFADGVGLFFGRAGFFCFWGTVLAGMMSGEWSFEVARRGLNTLVQRGLCMYFGKSYLHAESN